MRQVLGAVAIAVVGVAALVWLVFAVGVRQILGVELAIAVVAWAVFIVDYWRSRWWTSAAGRQLMATACVALGEAVSLGLLVAGVHVPVWVFAVGFGLADVVVVSWVVLRWRAGHHQKERERS